MWGGYLQVFFRVSFMTDFFSGGLSNSRYFGAVGGGGGGERGGGGAVGAYCKNLGLNRLLVVTVVLI